MAWTIEGVSLSTLPVVLMERENMNRNNVMTANEELGVIPPILRMGSHPGCDPTSNREKSARASQGSHSDPSNPKRLNRRVVHRIAFRILPALDTVLMFEGQRYVVVGSSLYTRVDGETVPLIHWRSHCATCAEPFEFRTGLKAGHPNRRCAQHHNPGKAVTEAGRARQKRLRSKSRRRTNTA